MEHDKHDRAKESWLHKGQKRPEFAIEPADNQESVWDYPRPPVIKSDNRHVTVEYNKQMIADSRNAKRILETASPPTFYIPRDDVNMDFLFKNQSSTYCEWKGKATYFDYVNGDTVRHNVAWSYENPNLEYATIRNFLCFYPSVLNCFVDNLQVLAQAGSFYGGWITPEIVGPFKGDPGTASW